MKQDSKLREFNESQSDSEMSLFKTKELKEQEVLQILTLFFDVNDDKTADEVDSAICEAIISIINTENVFPKHVSELLRLQTLIRSVSNILYRPRI